MWLGVLPGALLLVALLVLPGFLILWSVLRFNAPSALLYSPPVGAVAIALGTLVLPIFGIGWNLLSLLVWLLLTVGGSIGIAKLLRAKHRARRGSEGASGLERGLRASDEISWRALAWGGVGLLVFAVSYSVPVLGAMGSPEALPTLGDAQYHMTATGIVLDSGYAGPLHQFEVFYPDTEAGIYYPTLWHSLVAAVGFFYPVVEATNIAALVVGLILWPWGIVALVLGLRPGGKFSALLAPILAVPFVVMPAVIMFSNAIFPLGISTVMVIFTLGLLARTISAPTAMNVTALVAAGLAATAGHATSGLLVLASLAMWLLVVLGSRARSAFTEGRTLPGALLVGVPVVVIGAALVLIPKLSLVQSLNARPTEFVPVRRAIGNFVTGQALAQVVSFVPLALCVLAVVGVVLTIRLRASLVLGLYSAFLFAMYVAAAGPESYLRIFTSPWWKDATRFVIVMIPLIVVFAAIALDLLLGRLLKRSSNSSAFLYVTGGTVAALALLLGILDTPWSLNSVKARYITDSYLREADTTVGLTEDEVTLLELLDEEYPAGTVIVGDPDTGVAWSAIVTDLEQFQQLRFPEGADQAYLAAHFDQIGVDPHVCELVTANSIELLIVSGEPSSQFGGYHTGYNNVDTSEGFELVQQVGEARAYSITACD